MLLFLLLGGLGIVLLVISTVLDDVLGGLFDFDVADGFLSGPAISAFLSAFGFAGAFALSSGAPMAGALGVGVGAGVVLGGLAGVAMRTMMSMPTDATPTTEDFIGLSGVVVTAIPSGGIGEVNVSIGGAPQKTSARSQQGDLPQGTMITVVAALSPTLMLVTNLPNQQQGEL